MAYIGYAGAAAPVFYIAAIALLGTRQHKLRWLMFWLSSITVAALLLTVAHYYHEFVQDIDRTAVHALIVVLLCYSFAVHTACMAKLVLWLLEERKHPAR